MSRHLTAVSDDLATLIGAQSGMVARWQAREHELPDHALRSLLSGGRWRACSPGVYATFPGMPTRQADLWGAILHCSHRPRRVTGDTHHPDAVLSHATAAELYGFGGHHDPLIHVTIPSGRRKPKARPGVIIHFSGRLERSRHPVLWPPRTRLDDTILDLTQASGDASDAIGWVTRACERRLTTPTRLAEAAASRSRLRWRAQLHHALRAAENRFPPTRPPP
jgi:hypothetical protein